MPLWYDFGLEYGEEWKRQIAENIKSAKAVIMFITTGILNKEQSYVRKEFDIARMYGVNIIPVFLDKIEAHKVPTQYADWWVDLSALHGVNATGNDTAILSQQIMRALGFNELSAPQSDQTERDNEPSQSNTDPRTEHIAPGSKVKYGRYPQNVDMPEPIEWRVVDVVNGKALMISEKLLDARRFDANSNDWQNSELRWWLNNDFIRDAFSPDERRKLNEIDGDKVTLFTIEEAKKYLGSNGDRVGITTQYSRNRGAYSFSSDDSGWWWLRSPGDYNNHAAHVNINGFIRGLGGDVRGSGGAVRPVVLVSL